MGAAASAEMVGRRGTEGRTVGGRWVSALVERRRWGGSVMVSCSFHDWKLSLEEALNKFVPSIPPSSKADLTGEAAKNGFSNFFFHLFDPLLFPTLLVSLLLPPLLSLEEDPSSEFEDEIVLVPETSETTRSGGKIGDLSSIDSWIEESSSEESLRGSGSGANRILRSPPVLVEWAGYGDVVPP